MAAVMFTGANRHFFGVFIFLKTMLNRSLYLPQYDPKTPPAWLSHLMDRFGSPKYKNESFSEFWRDTDAQEAARVARNEKPVETIVSRGASTRSVLYSVASRFFTATSRLLPTCGSSRLAPFYFLISTFRIGFAQFWKQIDDQEEARIARNEKSMEAPGPRQP